MPGKPAWNRSTRLHEAPRRQEESSAQDAGFAAEQGEQRGRPRSRRSSRSAVREPRAPATLPTSPPPPPPPPPSLPSHAHDADESHEKQITRAMIERAVSAAFGSVMMEPSPEVGVLKDNAHQQSPDPTFESSSERASSPHHHSNKENAQRQAQNALQMRTAARPLSCDMQSLALKYEELQQTRSQRKQQHDDLLAQAQSDAKTKVEFYRRLNVAADEFHKRKLAIQALSERVRQEIQYLRATAADLDKRQQLLEDAYSNYEHTLRLEFGQHK